MYTKIGRRQARREEIKVRVDGRQAEELRPVKITRGYLKMRRVLFLLKSEIPRFCSASVDDKVPPFLKGPSRLGYGGICHAPRAIEVRTIRIRQGQDCRTDS